MSGFFGGASVISLIVFTVHSVIYDLNRLQVRKHALFSYNFCSTDTVVYIEKELLKRLLMLPDHTTLSDFLGRDIIIPVLAMLLVFESPETDPLIVINYLFFFPLSTTIHIHLKISSLPHSRSPLKKMMRFKSIGGKHEILI